MCFVGFNSLPNLIVTLFNLLYLVFIVGFNCTDCVIERESVRRLKLLKIEEVSRVACDLASLEVMHVPCT